MPCDVATWIEMDGEQSDIESVFQQMKSDDNAWDFNCLIPMPSYVYRGNLSKEARLSYPGDRNWLDWSLKHWGTKWNSYQAKRLGANKVYFETAWSLPSPVVETLAFRYPNVRFAVEWLKGIVESAGQGLLFNGKYILFREEWYGAWQERVSDSLIHSINLKYNRNEYIEYLKYFDGDTNVSKHYLNLAISSPH